MLEFIVKILCMHHNIKLLTKLIAVFQVLNDEFGVAWTSSHGCTFDFSIRPSPVNSLL